MNVIFNLGTFSIQPAKVCMFPTVSLRHERHIRERLRDFEVDKTGWLLIFSLFYFLFFKWKRCTGSICARKRLRARTLGITKTGTGQREINRITAWEVSERNVLKTNICALSQCGGAAANDNRCDIVIFPCEIEIKCFESTPSLCFIWRAALSPVCEDKVHSDLSSNISSLDVCSSPRRNLRALL